MGGCSLPPFEQLNLGLHVQDEASHVIQNRREFAHAMNTSLDHFCFAQQTHGQNIHWATSQDKGRGIESESEAIPDTDAFISIEKGIFLSILSADCVPILMYDSQQKIIAAVHAGWKGTVSKIAALTALNMIGNFGSKPEFMYVGIGPSISAPNYEVGKEVEEKVLEAFGTKEHFMHYNPDTGRYHFDLWYSNRKPLEELGIPPENIECAGICTYQQSDLFYSSRKDKGRTGRFLTGIMLL